MAEIVGKMTCPICGEPNQDVKVNKNNKLYIYCDNGCMARLSSKLSRQGLAALHGKRSAVFSKIKINPVQDCGNFAVANDDDDEDF